MAALAYLLPPLTGLVAYFGSSSARIRWHGLQSILLGLLWPVGLFVGGLATPGVTRAAGGLGAAAWLTFLIGAATGRDPRWPLVGRWLAAAAQQKPR
jgi:uncharacterized membrane protein